MKVTKIDSTETLISVKNTRPGMDPTHCFYCQISFLQTSHTVPTVDHIFPKSIGGLDIRNNRAPCCSRCNSEKGSMSLGEFRNYVMKSKRFLEVEKKLIHDNITRLIPVVENELRKNIYWVGEDMKPQFILEHNVRHIKAERIDKPENFE